MELEEDIGTMVRHNYTLHNKGRWTVRNVTAKVRYFLLLCFGDIQYIDMISLYNFSHV